jgi:hypothetical protein
MYRYRLINLVINLAGCLLFMALPVLFINHSGSDQSAAWLRSPYYWLFSLSFILLYYLNSAWLIPRFFFRKQYLVYSLFFCALFVLFYWLKPFDQLLRHTEDRNPFPALPALAGNFPPPSAVPDHKDLFREAPPGPPRHEPGPRRVDINSIFIFVMVMALSTATRVVQQWKESEKRTTQAERGRALAELAFLKAQINPHFLFNTLNNIYTLAATGHARTAESIMRLSNIMRYVTDEVSVDQVPLEQELSFIRDYIALQRLRLGEAAVIDFEVTGDPAGKRIAPLLLIPFIENAFKYGFSKREPSALHISLQIGADEIHFFCRNRIYRDQVMEARSGIGISNVRDRLERLYAGRYSLDISRESGCFTVDLIIKTS